MVSVPLQRTSFTAKISLVSGVLSVREREISLVSRVIYLLEREKYHWLAE